MRRDLATAAIGGGIGGLLDCIYATVLWGFILGDNPAGVWQSVAAGLLGKEAAYSGGTATAALTEFRFGEYAQIIHLRIEDPRQADMPGHAPRIGQLL